MQSQVESVCVVSAVHAEHKVPFSLPILPSAALSLSTSALCAAPKTTLELPEMQKLSCWAKQKRGTLCSSRVRCWDECAEHMHTAPGEHSSAQAKQVPTSSAAMERVCEVLVATHSITLPLPFLQSAFRYAACIN